MTSAAIRREGDTLYPQFGRRVVRVVMLDGAPWFAATDVRDALGSTHRKYPHLGPDEVRVLREHGGRVLRGRGLAVLSAEGLERLLASSLSPEADAFRAWVEGDVLPDLAPAAEAAAPAAEVAAPAAPHADEDALIAEATAILRARAARLAAEQAAVAAKLSALERLSAA